MKPRTTREAARRLLLALVGSALVMGLGYFFNRILDWDQLVAFFPTAWLTRVVSSDLFGSDTYPAGVQVGFFIFHVVFWASVVYLCLTFRARRRASLSAS